MYKAKAIPNKSVLQHTDAGFRAGCGTYIIPKMLRKAMSGDKAVFCYSILAAEWVHLPCIANSTSTELISWIAPVMSAFTLLNNINTIKKKGCHCKNMGRQPITIYFFDGTTKYKTINLNSLGGAATHSQISPTKHIFCPHHNSLIKTVQLRCITSLESYLPGISQLCWIFRPIIWLKMTKSSPAV